MRFLRRSRNKTFFSFGAIQAMQLGLPLVALPWLSRVLGPEAFGLLMYMCVLPPIINLVMDWGLPLGAARAAAREKSNKQKLRDLLGDVFAAKILLICIWLPLALAAMPFVPHAMRYPLAYFLAIMTGICRGISPLWFFQGAGRCMTKMAAWDVGASLLALLLVFLLIRAPADWPLYLLFLVLCKGGAYLWLNGRLWHAWRPNLNFKKGFMLLRNANALFACSFFSMIYLYGSQLVLGWFLSSAQMGIYVAVNKMIRALANVATPFAQTVFPRICSIKSVKPKLAAKLLRFSLLLSGLLILLGVGMMWIIAPFLIKIALGSDYPEAVPVLRIMLLAVPFLACDTVLASSAMTAYGFEAAQAKILGFMSAASMGLACILAWRANLVFAAWLPLCVETGIFFCYMLILRQKKIKIFFLGQNGGF